MKRIKQIEGKTIKEAEYGGRDYQGADNRTLQLTFTDGTEFCLDVSSRLNADGVFFSNPSSDAPPKRLYRD